MTTTNKLILFLCAFTLAACTGSIEDFATNMLYPISSANKTPIPETPIDQYAKAMVQVENGSVLVWYHRHSNPHAPVIIYFHGNGMNIGSLASSNMLKKMLTLGAHIVVYDYPKYGISTGELSQRGLVGSGANVFSWTRSQFPTSSVTLWGQSLGAAVAIQVAKIYEQQITRLILTQPWDELRNLVLTHYSSLAGQLSDIWFQTHEYNSAKVAQNLRLPTLMHHGLNDQLIPHAMGLKLSQSFPQGVAQFFSIPGKEHNDLLLEQKIWDDIAHFIR